MGQDRFQGKLTCFPALLGCLASSNGMAELPAQQRLASLGLFSPGQEGPLPGGWKGRSL